MAAGERRLTPTEARERARRFVERYREVTGPEVGNRAVDQHFEFAARWRPELPAVGEFGKFGGSGELRARQDQGLPRMNQVRILNLITIGFENQWPLVRVIIGLRLGGDSPQAISA